MHLPPALLLLTLAFALGASAASSSSPASASASASAAASSASTIGTPTNSAALPSLHGVVSCGALSCSSPALHLLRMYCSSEVALNYCATPPSPPPRVLQCCDEPDAHLFPVAPAVALRARHLFRCLRIGLELRRGSASSTGTVPASFSAPSTTLSNAAHTCRALARQRRKNCGSGGLTTIRGRAPIVIVAPHCICAPSSRPTLVLCIFLKFAGCTWFLATLAALAVSGLLAFY
ncbi:hypothetical protein FB451DRAFT_1570140 [Mycena latifolia]|nr:hypothetical protein FB451DRAFT_1572940 [Mycena latifolia]KAJ7438731.1 hypothetical protein FB451DRAFT_1570140 [Mycena latifolia]